MKKRIIFTIIGLLIMIGILGGIKGLQIDRMIAQGSQSVPPPETVTTSVAQKDSWESRLTAVGSLAAVQGVTVTAELTGKVVRIAFEPGTKVNSGDLLIQQDTSSEEAQLRAAEATVELAKRNLERLQKLLDRQTIAQSQYDNAEAQYKEGVARADAIRAAIAKKNIRAPFAGRLGIRLVNLGQILNEGEPIVSLQSIIPIFVNFSLPQQQLAQVEPGLTVRITSDALPGQLIEGKITAINPEVDAATRNIRIQATVANRQERLRPGMFVNVAVVLPASEDVLAVPATAVLYAPYSDSVFVVEEKQSENNKQSGLVLRQQVVQLGERRGDFVAVVSGLEAGETIVSTGAFKLRNGQAVVVDNTLAPEFKLAPEPTDS
ncbi:MAG: efflux RND transporter periplasmic adaptor subunit [Desulfobacteraceae bacterium]|jgi:membrane fusion protein (multidrug efflux system)|nr:efflux RND transporter periplasmic adaptor subunit [Desulfobacteraceae bacterium]